MSAKGLDFKHKEVINIKDGKRLGLVQDVTANLETGVITSIIVPR
jgi:sporulation protein YlmC with PRC-barrel domain